jgi:hypothetical protein
MPRRPQSFAWVLVVVAVGRSAGAASIDHKAVGCVVADRYPRFEARLEPAESVKKARVFFRGEGTSAWYAVAMKPAGPVFAAVLPKPNKTLHSFSYYVEVADAALATSRTQEYTAKVVADQGACGKEVLGVPVAGASSVLVEAPAGAPAVPAGFSGAGLVTAGVGGGIGTGTLIIGGAAAVGAGGGALLILGGGDDGVEGTWDGTRTVDVGPLFQNCVRVYNEHWVVTRTGSDVVAEVTSTGQNCGSATCAQNCQIFPFPWNMNGTMEGETARLVVFGGTQCILSMRASGDSMNGSMSSCSEAPGMTQDVRLKRAK